MNRRGEFTIRIKENLSSISFVKRNLYLYIYLRNCENKIFETNDSTPIGSYLALTNFQSDHCIVVLIRFNVCHRGDLINRMRRFETSDNALNNDETCL